MDIWRAERTGIEAIDTVIAAYLGSGITVHGPDPVIPQLPVALLAEAEIATGLCMIAASDFAAFARDHGLEAESLSEEGYLASVAEFGYDDRTRDAVLDGEVVDGHDATYLTWGEDVFQIDFTAAQFGYTQFPLIQRVDESGARRFF